MKLHFNRSDLIDAGWDLTDTSETLVIGEHPDADYTGHLRRLGAFDVEGSYLVYSAAQNTPVQELDATLLFFKDVPRAVC